MSGVSSASPHGAFADTISNGLAVRGMSCESDTQQSFKFTTLEHPPSHTANISLRPGSNMSLASTQNHSYANKRTMLKKTREKSNKSGVSTVRATARSGSQDGNLHSVRAMQSYQKHMERQTAKLDRKLEAEAELKRRPGSGNNWQNRLTRPVSPKLRSLERSTLKT